MAANFTINIFVTSLDEVMPIPLKDWAKKVGKSASTLRAQAEAGTLAGAEKRGNGWVVNPLANALASLDPGAVNSRPRGKKGEGGGDVRKPAGRDGAALEKGGPRPGPGGWTEIDV